MHACGHDAHMAMCLTTGKILMAHKDDLCGIIYLCFEEGEETNIGWPAMLKALEDLDIDAVWGIHVYAAMDTGTLCVAPGPRMAGMSWVQPHFHGRGGHAVRRADETVEGAKLHALLGEGELDVAVESVKEARG